MRGAQFQSPLLCRRQAAGAQVQFDLEELRGQIGGVVAQGLVQGMAGVVVGAHAHEQAGNARQGRAVEAGIANHAVEGGLGLGHAAGGEIGTPHRLLHRQVVRIDGL